MTKIVKCFAKIAKHDLNQGNDTMWISTTEAAERLDLTEPYFRRIYCNEARPLLTVRSNGLSGSSRRGLLVLRADVEALWERCICRPAS